MTDVEIMIKALRLAWIPRLLTPEMRNWKRIPGYDSMQDWVLFNNKEILVGGRPVFIKEWFDSNILTIRDLLNSNSQLLSFQELNNKYDCNMIFFNLTKLPVQSQNV